jgi:hypothetical protein
VAAIDAGGDAGARVIGGLVVGAAAAGAAAAGADVDVEEFGGATGEAASVVGADDVDADLPTVALSLCVPDEHPAPRTITSTTAGAQRCIVDSLASSNPA